MLHARVCSLILRVLFFCHPERSASKACPHQESRARSRRTPRDSPAPCDLREFLPKLVPVTAVLKTCCWLCECMHIATRISTRWRMAVGDVGRTRCCGIEERCSFGVPSGGPSGHGPLSGA